MTKTTDQIMSEPVALSDDLCLTAAGVAAAQRIACDLSDVAAVARLVADQIPAGYPDLQAACFLLGRDVERQAAELAELVQR